MRQHRICFWKTAARGCEIRHPEVRAGPCRVFLQPVLQMAGKAFSKPCAMLFLSRLQAYRKTEHGFTLLGSRKRKIYSYRRNLELQQAVVGPGTSQRGQCTCAKGIMLPRGANSAVRLSPWPPPWRMASYQPKSENQGTQCPHAPMFQFSSVLLSWVFLEFAGFSWICLYSSTHSSCLCSDSLILPSLLLFYQPLTGHYFHPTPTIPLPHHQVHLAF